MKKVQMPSDKKNSSWLSAQFIITLGFSLLTLKLNLSHFGKTDFGIWIALASIWGLGSALDFGFGTAIIKFVAEYNSQHKDRISKLISSTFVIFLINGLLIFSLGEAVGHYFYFSDENLISSELQNVYRIVFLVLGLAFYLQYMIMFFKSIFEGMSNFVISSRLTILQNTIILVGVIIITIFDFDITVLAFLYLISASLLLLSYVILFNKKYSQYKIVLRLFDFKQVKEILFYSFSVQVISIFTALIDPIIKYLIGSYYNVGFITVYEVARKFAIAISGLFFNAFRIVLPKSSVLKSREEIQSFVTNDIVRYTKLGLTYSGLAFGVLSLPIIALIYFVFGIEEAIVTFLILALPESINNFGYAIYSLLMGIGRIHFLAILQFINLSVVVVSLIVGFSLFQTPIGLIGYFISVLIGNILMLLYLKYNLKVSLHKFLAEVKIYKLGLLITTFLISIGLLLSQSISPFILFTVLGLLSYFIFYSELKFYSSTFINIVKVQFFNKSI